MLITHLIETISKHTLTTITLTLDKRKQSCARIIVYYTIYS